MKQRSNFWDNYKGLLIILVVFGHFIYDYGIYLDGSRIKDIFSFIYLFHMPAFVLCSGYFSKSENACSKKSLLKLLLCYIVFNTVLMIYYCCQGSTLRLITPYASTWYILALIVWRLTVKHLDKIKGILPISIAAAILIGFWEEFSNVFSLSRIVAFFPFFLVGYRMDESKLQKHLQGRTVWKSVLSYVIAAVVCVSLLVVVSRSSISVAMLTMQPYVNGIEMLYRGFIMLSAVIMIIVMMITVPDRKIPLLTKTGKNCLLLYLTHRLLTLVFSEVFPYTDYNRLYLVYAVVATVAVVLIFGSDVLNKWFNRILERILAEILNKESKIGRRIVSLTLAVAVLVCAIPLAKKAVNVINIRNQNATAQRVVSEEVDDAIVLSFVGDLLLLKDQVEAAYDDETGEYRFDAVFEYAKKYLSEADFAIGVFEGPMAGEEKGYTTSDYYDRAKLYNNFPDAFAYAVKNAGIDFVSTANNHLLDMGVEGALRTLDVLDAAGLAHTGAYRNSEEKEQVTIVDIEGIKIAILAYSWAFNNYSNEDLIVDYPYITSILPDENDVFFPQLMAEIEGDFASAKASGADLIIVMPHMGTQFSHETDAFQDYWNQTFSQLGADIILGDHAHAVQPIEYIGETVVVNCPGNFINSYIQYDGDATAIVEIYIDRETQKPIATAVVPMYSQEMEQGYFRALPIYDILSQNALYEQMTNIDLERVDQIHKLVTKVMVGKEINTKNVQPRYFYVGGRYCEKQYSLLGDIAQYNDTPLYQYIDAASTVVFIGDSITNGSHNSGHPWYEPIMAQFGGKTVVNISEPSYTVTNVLESFSSEISQSNGDLYIVAIGTNDVRYRDEQICAMTPEEYVSDIDDLVALILEANPEAKIALISPWMTLSNDRNSKVAHEEKLEMIAAYSEALEAYAYEKAYCYLDPNAYLLPFFETHHRRQYTNDDVHPNSAKGIDLYSWAVMQSSKQEGDLLP